MDKKEAIESLKKSLREISHSRRILGNTQEFQLWHDKVSDIIEAAFGKSSLEYDRFIKAVGAGMKVYDPDQETLDDCKTALKSIIKKHELLETTTAEEMTGKEATMSTVQPKAFIAHGGDSPALRKLKYFLEALGVQPLVVEEQPSEGRSIAENVDYYARQSDFAIILATKGDVDGKTGGFIPRGNVLIEIGKLQEIFKERIVYLLQAGTKLPTNISEKVRVRFSPQSMDNSFIKIAQELKKYEMLGVEKETAIKAKPAVKVEQKDTTGSPTQLFDALQLHPRIIKASKSLFNSGHYAEAIFAAFKAINNFTKRKIDQPLDGKDLMAKAFNEDKPIIKINKLTTRSEQDEQEGFRFLFMGAMVGIRNPKAHDDIRQIDPYKTLEYLAFASLLMRRVTEGKLEPKEHPH